MHPTDTRNTWQLLLVGICFGRSAGLEGSFDACGSNSGFARGRVMLQDSKDQPVVVEVQPCGFGALNATVNEELLHRVMLQAAGPFAVHNSFQAERDLSAFLSAFAAGALASLASSCKEARDLGALSCQDCPPVFKLGQGSGERHDHEEVSVERAMVEGLAAASFVVVNGRETAGADRADYVELANRTNFLRWNENAFEWDDPQRTRDRRKCLAEGDLHGYKCHTFTYGSTYYPSWLRVMRFPAVTEAIAKVKSEGGEVVVLGSSLGWQTIWTALTFGVRTVGYELMNHRVRAARVAAEGLPEGLVEFRQEDASSANLSKARIIYMTDLIWEDFLCSMVAYHVKQSLLEPGAHKDAIVVSNKHRSWVKAGFQSVGKVHVPVTWLDEQAFHIWRLPDPSLPKAMKM